MSSLRFEIKLHNLHKVAFLWSTDIKISPMKTYLLSGILIK